MKDNFKNPTNGNAAATSADATLRLIAGLPAPQGLEERVHRKLSAARAQRTAVQQGRLLAWPAAHAASREWLRGAAAAAIAFVIAGGGWGVYRQVQPKQTVNGIRLSPHGAAGGGLAGAGAMRTPQTLNGPVLSGPALTATKSLLPAAAASAKSEKKKSVVHPAGEERNLPRAQSAAQTGKP
jgi:hypothetical protein